MTRSALTESYASVLKQLRILREARGVSQVELARRLGRTQPFVSYIERGERRIDVVEFCAICRAMDLDPTEIFAQVVAELPPILSI